MPAALTKDHAHELIESMNPAQVPEAVRLLEKMLDPVAWAIANAPFDDEPVSEEERQEIETERAHRDTSRYVSHDEVLADFGLTRADFERMAATPLPDADTND